MQTKRIHIVKEFADKVYLVQREEVIDLSLMHSKGATKKILISFYLECLQIRKKLSDLVSFLMRCNLLVVTFTFINLVS